MYEISLMSQSDLKEAYEIEKTTNPTPWSKENFSRCGVHNSFLFRVYALSLPLRCGRQTREISQKFASKRSPHGLTAF